jgi:3-methyladenine DNA glycosylase Mpg
VDAATQQVVDLEAYRAQAEDAARARGGERPRSGAGIGARA